MLFNQIRKTKPHIMKLSCPNYKIVINIIVRITTLRDTTM